MARQKLQPSVTSPLAPDDIRRIRESLGLSKTEAGELIGGGPRAFTKYESGQIQPAAAVANLLRLLEAAPSALHTLMGKKAPPIEHDGRGPLRVTGQHVAVLSDRKLAALTRRLLSAEAQSQALPLDRIHVASNLTSADEGEDARIEWKGGPSRTPFLPARRCLFQLKATEVSPAAAAADICTSAGQIEPAIRRVLEEGGAYIILCSRSLTKKQIRAREDRLNATLSKECITVDSQHLQFRDADQIAEWTNTHPAVAAWVLQQTQPGLVGPFRDWSHWTGRHEHERSPLIADPRLPEFREALRVEVAKLRSVVRVVGYVGIGKSRLTLEALCADETEEEGSPRVSDLVLYAVESEAGAAEIKSVVQSLADASMRALVVVDRCAPETHIDLAAIVKRSESRLSLITLDHEMPGGSVTADLVLTIEEAESSVIEGILNARTSGLRGEDQRRLLKFAAGNPLMAILVSQAWNSGQAISSATDDTLIDTIIYGRRTHDPGLLLDASLRLSAFGFLGAKPPRDQDMVIIAALGRPWTVDELRAAFDELAARGVVRPRGRLITLQPAPVALALAERQWRQWSPERWDDVLTGSLPTHLRTGAAHRLSLLNARSSAGTQPVAVDVARHLCRLNGPLNSIERLSLEGAAEVLSQLAEVETESVVLLLEHVTKRLARDDLHAIDGDVRRHLVRALQKIAFVPDTFERGALLLLRLAVAENETWSNNATGAFKALFPVLGGDTAADAQARLQVLDEVLNTTDDGQLVIAVDALLAGAKTHSFSRSVGAEIHGSRPALQPWQPLLWKDAWDYVIECLNRLATVALRHDSIGTQARAGLGHGFRSLVANGLIDTVESLVHRVTAAHAYWPAALNSLGDILQYDYERVQPGITVRVQRLIATLTPSGLADRVRYLVTEMPWDYPDEEQLTFEERGARQLEAVRQLVKDLLAVPGEIARFFPQLSQGEQRNAFEFGSALAELSAEPLQWREAILQAVENTPRERRNFVLLTGYFAALAKREPEATAAFKAMAWNSNVFSPALPLVCWSMNITTADIELVCRGLAGESIVPRHLFQWQCGGVLAKLPPSAVAPLFDQLLTMDVEGVSQAIYLMGMYVHQARERLEELRPQLRRMANLPGADAARRLSPNDAYHFKELLEWILRKGPTDADARAIATTLAKRLAEDIDHGSSEMIRPLLPMLLSTFADAVWPIVGQAIASDRSKRWQLAHVLGDPYSDSDDKKPALLSLPEEILFGWCHANPEAGPAFVAEVAPLVMNRQAPAEEQKFHPTTLRLLSEFGARDDVLNALTRNIHTFSWSGSRQNYYVLFERPLGELAEHPLGAVRRWARNQLAQLGNEKTSAKNEDEEMEAGWEL